jgi:hypothetical protein
VHNRRKIRIIVVIISIRPLPGLVDTSKTDRIMGSWSLILQVIAVVAVSAFQQEITFYTEVDQGGEAIRFRSSQNDLSNYAATLNNSKSLCVKGQ